MHQLFERAFKFPAMVRGVEVMRRNRHHQISGLCSAEQFADVGDDAMFGHAFADNAPGHAIGAEEVDLWVGDDQRDAALVQHHA
ncbi:hypothetical protein [Phaeovulum sp.]|uniref:hypothetical protein n=1 Tax=Phaeovulum sp. TaxID=2934796 RepID=UPI003014AD04